MMTKEESTKIVNLMTSGVGYVVLGCSIWKILGGGIGEGKRASRQRGEGKILMMCINVHHNASFPLLLLIIFIHSIVDLLI